MMGAAVEGRWLGFRRQWRPWLPRAQEPHIFVQMQRSCSVAMVRGRFCELHRRRITLDEDFGVVYTMRFRMGVISSDGQIRNLELFSKRLNLQEIRGR
ncbi:uncharacterized protein DS421_6g195280 [Arachis hypogaea]|nr:uncharacterized protein DS421_6g195280 [Arachis hypogaea]